MEASLESEIEVPHMDGKSVGSITPQELLYWKVYVDRAANQRGSRVELLLVSPERLTIEKSLKVGFSVTNNEADYEALLEEMSMVQKMGGKAVKMFSYLRPVVGQMGSELEVRDERI